MSIGASDVIFQGYLPAAQGVLFAAPDALNAGRVEIDAIWLCNTMAVSSPTTLLYGRGVLTKANALFWLTPIEANRTHIVFGGEPVNLKAGFKFEGNAGAGADVVVTIFGRTFVG